MVKLFLRWKDSHLLLSVHTRTSIGFNRRTELEIIQFLNIALVLGNALKVSVGPQAAVTMAAKLLQIRRGRNYQLLKTTFVIQFNCEN